MSGGIPMIRQLSASSLLRVGFPGSELRNKNVASLDRLSVVGEHFKSGRTWATAAQGVQHVWVIIPDIYRYEMNFVF